jgi:hypothetical protein
MLAWDIEAQYLSKRERQSGRTESENR